MVRFIETGVELFKEKHRVITEIVDGKKPQLFGVGSSVARYATEVANLESQCWIKHRYLEEPLPARMHVRDWIEYMLRKPISLDELRDRVLRVHHVDLREHVI